MHPRDRLIVALDVSSLEEVDVLTQQLCEHVGMFKIGLELAAAVGWPAAIGAVRGMGGRVMCDAKLHDTPETVGRAARELCRHAVTSLTLHCAGGPAMMQRAVAAARVAASAGAMERPRVIGVTVLTSLSPDDLFRVGLLDDDGADETSAAFAARGASQLEAIVVTMAREAQRCELDGVVASPKEARAIRERCGADFEIITPGVRPAWASEAADQKRVLTPAEAFRAGATRIVVGRPITQPPEGLTSVEAAQRIVEEIASVI